MGTAADSETEAVERGDVHVAVQLACTETQTPDVETIETWVQRAAAASQRLPVGVTEVTVRIVNEDEIRRLNAHYREQPKPTNVLAFPAGDDVPVLPGEPNELGDVVICAAVVAAEALNQGKSAADHWAHIVVHGTLHLLGFDHLIESDAQEMESLETRVLASAGIADPYTSQ